MNLSNAIFETAEYHIDVFKGTRNLVICNKCNKLRTFISSQLDCIVIDCSSNWRSKQKRLNTENNECVPDCRNINNKYDYLSKCYNIFLKVLIMIIIYVTIVIQIVKNVINPKM